MYMLILSLDLIPTCRLWVPTNLMGTGLGTKLNPSQVMGFLVGGFCICRHGFEMEKPRGFVPVVIPSLARTTPPWPPCPGARHICSMATPRHIGGVVLWVGCGYRRKQNRGKPSSYIALCLGSPALSTSMYSGCSGLPCPTTARQPSPPVALSGHRSVLHGVARSTQCATQSSGAY